MRSMLRALIVGCFCGFAAVAGCSAGNDPAASNEGSGDDGMAAGGHGSAGGSGGTSDGGSSLTAGSAGAGAAGMSNTGTSGKSGATGISGQSAAAGTGGAGAPATAGNGGLGGTSGGSASGAGGIASTGGSSADGGQGGKDAAGGQAGASAGAAGSAPDCGDPVVGTGAPLASLGACGKLVYRTYENRDEPGSENVLPDFSFAGYERGGVAIPDDVPVVVTVDPVPGDARAVIQTAIDEASKKPLDARGYRGAVLLRKGRYEVGDTLHVSADGVVVRGEGQGADGTILVASAAKQYTLLELKGSGSGLGEIADTRTAIESDYVGVGARSFTVSSAGQYSPGDSIAVVRVPNQKWIDDLGMDAYGWTADQYDVAHERTVTAVNGNVLTVDIPIVDTVEARYGGGYVFRSKVVGRIRHTGVEDLRMESVYASETDENHSWVALRLSRVESSFVRRVTTRFFAGNAVAIADSSAFNTVEDVADLDPKSEVTGGRRYPFYVDKGIGNLFQRCFARNGRHNFVSGARATGPNVWLDCLGVENHADDGPHHRWATGLLFDNTKSGSLRVQNRKDSGTGHGWSGAQILFWNAATDTLTCDAPKGAMSWSIGSTGKKVEGSWAPEEPEGWFESHGTPVEPRSLYLQQLRDRLGQGAVDAITVAAQRDGRIWDALAAWAGEGRLDDHLP
jgi:hypothetical protein